MSHRKIREAPSVVNHETAVTPFSQRGESNCSQRGQIIAEAILLLVHEAVVEGRTQTCVLILSSVHYLQLTVNLASS